MKISVFDLEGYAGFAGRCAAREAAGYDTLVIDETRHDPFVRAGVAVQATRQMEVMTGIAVAFARTPMTLALAAHDLNVVSGGRFRLGLGSQVKAHITRRYAMPWSKPAARMREMIAAIHAIWDCWHDGKPLDFQGEFYSHTLMTFYFTPHDLEFGRPPIDLAAVGPLMTRVAAECADGLITHSFSTPGYLRDVTLPAVEAGLAVRGWPRERFQISVTPFVAVGETDEALAAARAQVRAAIAFYGSTPAYRGVLDHHGWGALHEALLPLSKQNRWQEMAALIEDDVFDTFAVSGTGKQVVAGLRERYGAIADRLAFTVPADTPDLAGLVAALKG